MILEVAILSIHDPQRAAFEAAFGEARKVISAMPGFVSHQLQRCIETPGRYVLLVQWQTIEHHMQGFRESPQFQQWRALLGPFFSGSPQVEHYDSVSQGGPA